jgi:formylglycine-generating enzyme required for sulfatase activity
MSSVSYDICPICSYKRPNGGIDRFVICSEKCGAHNYAYAVNGVLFDRALLKTILNSSQRKAGDVVTLRVKGADFKMVYCPKGTFTMRGDGKYVAPPQHRVELTRPFLMGQTQVTQAQWEVVMGPNPSHFKGSQLPVEQVSWFDCVRFLNALSEAGRLTPVYSVGSGDEPTVEMNWEANGFRLPTEAEWEYASRGGQDLAYAGSENLDEFGWYEDNSNDETHPVGQKKSNSWGVYDMSGNVFEWCNDEWDSDRYKERTGTTRDPRPFASAPAPRVRRGGLWWFGPNYCRVACRSGYPPGFSGSVLGFRFLRWNFDT